MRNFRVRETLILMRSSNKRQRCPLLDPELPIKTIGVLRDSLTIAIYSRDSRNRCEPFQVGIVPASRVL